MQTVPDRFYRFCGNCSSDHEGSMPVGRWKIFCPGGSTASGNFCKDDENGTGRRAFCSRISGSRSAGKWLSGFDGRVVNALTGIDLEKRLKEKMQGSFAVMILSMRSGKTVRHCPWSRHGHYMRNMQERQQKKN